MIHDKLTTWVLIVLTVLSAAACLVAVVRLRKKSAGRGLWCVQLSLTGLCTAGSMGLFTYRALVVHRGWQPLESHVDGLLLIAALFAVMVLFLQSLGGVAGLATFALPVLTLILAWAICASAWTFYFFEIDSVWKTVHLAAVYLGTLFFAVAAIGGGMFLYVQRGLRCKRLGGGRGLASLEAIERLIVWASASGFALLSLGLAMGLILVASGPTKLGEGWWYSPKFVAATAVWLIYGAVMNARHAASYRGARAAWLSIAGLVLLLVTFGLVHATSDANADTAEFGIGLTHVGAAN